MATWLRGRLLHPRRRDMRARRLANPLTNATTSMAEDRAQVRHDPAALVSNFYPRVYSRTRLYIR
jgi:hypothetical protein